MRVNQVIDIHAHILVPGVMGSCGSAGPEMGFRDNGNEFFRAGDYFLENVKFNNSPFSVPQKRVEKMALLGIDLQLVSPNPITYFYHQPYARQLDERQSFKRKLSQGKTLKSKT